METKDVIYTKPLRHGHNSMEHGITLLLHVGPIHKKLLSDGILSVLNHYEVPIYLEIIPKSVIMKVGGPLIGVFMSIDHRLILSPCAICRLARVTKIHSSKGVLIISPKWTLNLLNYVTSSCFSCIFDSLALSHICSFLISLGGTCITSPSSFPCCPPWAWRRDHLDLSYHRRRDHHVMPSGLPLSCLASTHDCI
jgi:hypothetical protein